MQKMFIKKTYGKLRLLDGLEEIKPNGSFTLFLRHADRDKIPEGQFGNEIELNELGKKRSEEFGKLVQHLNVNRIFSSPLKRCIQTAEFIALGLNRGIVTETSTLLGDPGAFVHDGKMAGESFLQMGFNNCYENLLKHITVNGNYDISEGAKTLDDFFLRQSEIPGVNIYISHDMIVALYAYERFQKKYTLGKNWVKFLGGLIIKIEQ